jgi:hypothetical protein
MSDLILSPDDGQLVWLGALGIQFKLDGTQTQGAFSVVEHPLEPGAFAPPHTHSREDEFSSGCHGIFARCCASQMQPFPFGTQRPESLLPQLARLSIQTVSWRASQKDPSAYVLPHGTVHQNHAWNSDQLHVWIDALSPNIDIISVLTYPQF